MPMLLLVNFYYFLGFLKPNLITHLDFFGENILIILDANFFKMFGLILETVTFSGKTPSPIESTDDGIDTCVNDVHLLNAPFPIEVKEDGISNSISDNDSHPLKASFPIEIIEEGILTCVKDEHS